MRNCKDFFHGAEKFFLTLTARRFIIAFVGDVAQLGEHQVRNLGVKGSNPSVSTNTEIFKAEVQSFRLLRVMSDSRPRRDAS